jgi:hypothetical protein
MIEVHLSYNLKPGIDEQGYFEWMKQAIVPALKSRGIAEVRAYRNVKESQGVLVVGLWEKLEDWTEFSQSEGWNSLINPLQSTFATNIRIEVWGSSPVIPAPLRPPK